MILEFSSEIQFSGRYQATKDGGPRPTYAK